MKSAKTRLHPPPTLFRSPIGSVKTRNRSRSRPVGKWIGGRLAGRRWGVVPPPGNGLCPEMIALALRRVAGDHQILVVQ